MIDRKRPFISFVVFAYNQQRFIRDAVDSAFSQQCEPMEIILSDDCSTDETFAIMQEMAAAYSGPHEVIVRRNESNLGLIDHINKVFRLACGEWVVVAAGDDISMPNRVAEISRVISDYPNISMVSSALIGIDEAGNKKNVDHIFQPEVESSLGDVVISGLAGLIERNSPYVHGATLAYSRKLIRSFSLMPSNAVYEDEIFDFRAALLGAKAHINKPLICYRVHPLQSTNLYVGKQHKIFEKKRKLIVGQFVTSRQKIADFRENKYSLNEQYRVLVENLLINDFLEKKHQFRLYTWPWPFRVFPVIQMLISNPKHVFGMTKRDLAMIIMPSILSNFLIGRRNGG